jgi:hypothetical protein
MRPAICVVAAAVVLVGGCSAQRVEPPTFGPAPTVTTTAFPTLPTGPVAPAKYTKAAFKSCLDVRQKVDGDLPSPQPEDHLQTDPSGSSWTCIFGTAEQTKILGFRSWENTDNAAGVRSGAEFAQKYFTERTKSWQQDNGVNVGSEARWRDKSTAACALEILDENGVLIVSRANGTTLDEEQCRGSVRELAKKFFAAVQP